MDTIVLKNHHHHHHHNHHNHHQPPLQSHHIDPTQQQSQHNANISRSRPSRLIKDKEKEKDKDKESNGKSHIVNGETFDAEYLYGWQLSWKQIIANSVIYLDGSTGSTRRSDGNNSKEGSITEGNNSTGSDETVVSPAGRDKTRSQLKIHCFHYHARVVDFFNANEVTLIITRRTFDPQAKYQPNDIFYHNTKIRIWSFDKAVKFFARLSTKIELQELSRPKKNVISYRYLKANEIKRFEQVKIENVDGQKEESTDAAATEQENVENVENEVKPKEEKEKPEKPLQKSVTPLNNTSAIAKKPDLKIMYVSPSDIHNDNRMSLIKSLRKSSQTKKIAQAPPQKQKQKLNYQQQVFKMIKSQKAQNHHYQVAPQKTFSRNSGYKSIYPNKSSSYQTNDKLATLLSKEKLYGPTDRDMTIRQHDFVYFEHPFVFFHDLKQQYRPIVTKEWPTKGFSNLAIDAPWARIYPSVDGRCLFLADSFDPEHPTIIKRRKVMFENRKKFRTKLKKMFCDEEKQNDKDLQRFNYYEEVLDEYNEYSSKLSIQRLPTSTKAAVISTTISDKHDQPVASTQVDINAINSNKRSFYEMNASGITQSNSQSVFATSTTLGGSKLGLNGGNGLGPIHSHVASKEFKSLKKRIYEKTDDDKENQQKKTKESQADEANVADTKSITTKIINKKIEPCVNQNNNEKKEKNDEQPKNGGYCENCRIKYSDFSKHILEAKHREFAKDDKNFEKIDRFISYLQKEAY
ncbi:protein serine/threonine kinase activating protein [Saccharomycopsis crataegensis]|uniref:Protein serine/threonine kinase activating protein n=1 Tax=Saccharomycopsis crataegensis TaxID=43959 RepID=A0AAV5QNJ0_9ASCO|nr:protein serine/threonine kinase activating protein [Saccharomycopsis crataegensis]